MSEPQAGQVPAAPTSEAAVGAPGELRGDHGSVSLRRGRRIALRVVQLVVFVAAVHWLVVPRLDDTGEMVVRLDEVSPLLVGLGALLGVAALVAYAQVTRLLLPRSSRPGLRRAFGVVVSSVGVNRVAPLGVAAGAVVAFRLLTREGVRHGDVAFAMTVQGVGSAFVLQLLLWPAMLVVLLVSEVSAGLASGLAVAGGSGVALLVVVLVSVWGFVARREPTIGFVVRVAERLRIGGDRSLRDALGAIGDRLDRLVADRATVVRSAAWATANWLADAASLWVFLMAFGAEVSPLWVIVAFGVANLVAMVPVTPGSLGVVETTLAVVLIGFGAAASPVFLGVAAYRLVHYWLPIPGAALAYSLLRATRRSGAEAVPAMPAN